MKSIFLSLILIFTISCSSDGSSEKADENSSDRDNSHTETERKDEIEDMDILENEFQEGDSEENSTVDDGNETADSDIKKDDNDVVTDADVTVEKCLLNEKLCENSKWMACDENGEWQLIEECGNGETCVADSGCLNSAILDITIDEGSATNRMLIGANTDFLNGVAMFDFDDGPELTSGDVELDAYDRLNIQSIRYVGGTASNYWDWFGAAYVRDDEIDYDPIKKKKELFTDKNLGGPDSNFTPNAFYNNFAEKAGMEVIWVSNLGTGKGTKNRHGNTMTTDSQIIEHASDMYSYLKENSVPVKYVEMGNELFTDRDGAIFVSGTDYIRNHVSPVAKKIRELYPAAKIGVVGEPKGVFYFPSKLNEYRNSLTQRRKNWDSEIAANRNFNMTGSVTNFDAIIHHNYGFNVMLMPAEAGENHINWRKAYLSYGQASMRNMAENTRALYGESVDIWLTEFALLTTTSINGTVEQIEWIKNQQETPLYALFLAGNFLSGIEMNDTYKLMNIHTALGITGAGFMQIEESAGNEFKAEIKPFGQIISHLGSLMENSENMHTAQINGNPALGVEITNVNSGDLKALQAVALSSSTDETITLVVINRGEKDIILNTESIGNYSVKEKSIYSADAAIDPEADESYFLSLPKGDTPWIGGPMEVKVSKQHLENNSSFYDITSEKFSLTIVTFGK